MRVTGEAKLEKIGKHGEIPHGFLDESVFTYKLETYAKTFGLSPAGHHQRRSRRFRQTPLLIGRGAAQTFEEAFWKMVSCQRHLDIQRRRPTSIQRGEQQLISPPRRHPHSITLGSPAPWRRCSSRRTPQGYPVNLVPRYVVVPPELKAAADQLYRCTIVVAGQATTGGQPTLPNAQTFFGLYEPAVPRTSATPTTRTTAPPAGTCSVIRATFRLSAWPT